MPAKRKVKTLPQPYVSRTKIVYIGYLLKSSEVNSCPKQKAQERAFKWGSIILWRFGGFSQFWVSVSGDSGICVAVYG